MAYTPRCSLCNRVADESFRYIVSVVETDGNARCSYARRLTVCARCMGSRRNIATLKHTPGTAAALELHMARRAKRTHGSGDTKAKGCRKWSTGTES